MRLRYQLLSKFLMRRSNPKVKRHPSKFICKGGFLFIGAFLLAALLAFNPLSLLLGSQDAFLGIKPALANCGDPNHDHSSTTTPAASLTPAAAATPGASSGQHNMADMPGMDGTHSMDGMNMGDMNGMDMKDMPGMTMTPSASHTHTNADGTVSQCTASDATGSQSNMSGHVHSTGEMSGHSHGVTVTPPANDTKNVVLAGFAGANSLVIAMAAIARRKKAKKAQAKIINRGESR
ncbi:MAG TPA: hypothetical protein VH186_36755 [Chloroflexia bacterium]|nr:hypothetical protein [Chloroflexia bacterium]